MDFTLTPDSKAPASKVNWGSRLWGWQLSAALLIVVSAAACRTEAAGPPTIVVDRSACSHCGMLISEPVYSAAYQRAGAAARVFDDIGCMRTALQQESSGSEVRLWFHDASDGTWIAGREAVLVHSPAIRTPMGGGLLAHRDRVAAQDAAARHGGRIVSLDTFLSKEGW